MKVRPCLPVRRASKLDWSTWPSLAWVGVEAVDGCTISCIHFYDFC